MENASIGFKEIGDTKDEIDALCNMAVIKGHQDEYVPALELYDEAYTKAAMIQNWNLMIDIKQEQRRIYRMLGDRSRVIAAALAIDTLLVKDNDAEAMIANNNVLGDDALSMKTTGIIAGNEATKWGTWNLFENAEFKTQCGRLSVCFTIRS